MYVHAWVKATDAVVHKNRSYGIDLFLQWSQLIDFFSTRVRSQSISDAWTLGISLYLLERLCWATDLFDWMPLTHDWKTARRVGWWCKVDQCKVDRGVSYIDGRRWERLGKGDDGRLICDFGHWFFSSGCGDTGWLGSAVASLAAGIEHPWLPKRKVINCYKHCI